MATIEKRGDEYYENFQHRGRRYHSSLETGNEVLAWRRLRERVAEVKALASGGGAGVLSWDTFKKEYFRRRGQDRAGRTLRIEKYAISKLEDFAPLRTLEDFTPEAIEAYRIHRGETGHGLKGTNRDTRALKAVLRWAISKNLATPKNLDAIGIFKVMTEEQPSLDPDKLSALIKRAAKFPHHLAFAMLCGAGGERCAEAFWQRVEDCDMALRRLRVVPHAEFTPKSRKSRFIPMQDSLYLFLKWWLPQIPKDCKYVVCDPDGWRPASPEAEAASFKRQVVSRVGITGRARTHILRHSFATIYLGSGNELKDLKDILGHSSIQTTERYTHEAKSRLDATVKSMPGIAPVWKR